MTRILSTAVVLPIGDHDDEVTFDIAGHVTLRGETYDINIISATDPWGSVVRGAGLSARHASMIEDALVDAFERAERRADEVASEARVIVGLR